jgi:drug/metabolite transporter (DMT)-like permease
VHTGLAIGAALGSALCFALSSVLQQRGAARVPDDCGGRLILHLLRRPIWVFGLLAAVGTVVLQFVALAAGELALIQPLLLTGLLFALPVSVLLEKQRPDPREWGWAALLVVGLTLFLRAARPTSGPSIGDDSRMWTLGCVAVALIALAVVLGYMPARRHRAALLGFAAGIAYGISAALMKYCYGLASDHFTRLLTSWPAYTLIVVGTAGILLNQNAYRSGPLAGALPPLAIADPAVAVTFGVVAFGESLSTRPVALVLQAIGVIAVSVAIVQLARSSAGRDACDPRSTGETTKAFAGVTSG